MAKPKRYIIHPARFIGTNRQHYYIKFEDIVAMKKLNPEHCYVYGKFKLDGYKEFTWEHVRVTRGDLPDYFPDEFNHGQKEEKKGEEFYGFDEDDK